MTTETFAQVVYAARHELANDPDLVRHQAHNVLAAITWLTGDCPGQAAELMMSTRLAVAGAIGYRPLIEIVDRLLARGDHDTTAPAVVRWRGALAFRTGDIHSARQMWDQARATSVGDDRALALTNLSHLAREDGDFAESTVLLEEAEHHATSTHTVLSIVAQRSATEIWTGNVEQAQVTIERARTAMSEGNGELTGDVKDAMGYVLLNESVAFEYQGHFSQAVSSAREGVHLARRAQSLALEARLLEQLALTLGWIGSHNLAISVGEEALGLSELIGDAALEENCIGTLAFILWRADRSEDASALVFPSARPGGLSRLVQALVLVDRGSILDARQALTALIERSGADGTFVEEADARVAVSGLLASESERRSQLSLAAAAYRRAGHWRGSCLPDEADLRAAPRAC